jgi:hypothetical protein
MQVVVPTALQAPQSWTWITDEPGQKWKTADFDDSAWAKGQSGFGTDGTPGARVATRWDGNAIWLRRWFELPAAPLHEPQWCVHHDEDVEVWLDGQLQLTQPGYTSGYVYFPVTAAGTQLLTPGKHLLAVHCVQTKGGQYIDVGLSDLLPPVASPAKAERAAGGRAPGGKGQTATCLPLPAVRLLDGELLAQQESMHGYLLTENVDALLYNFQKNAGLPTTGKPLGGWEAPDCELRGHYTGHFLTALALMYESTGDERLKARGAQMVAELGRCQAALGGGYLSAYPKSFLERLVAGQRVWAPWYTLHKVAAGLLDQHVRCGNAQALTMAVQFAAWVKAFTDPLDDAAMQKMMATEFGGMPAFFADLYAVTKDDAHLALAKRFTHHRVLDPLAEGVDKLKGLHANTQIPKLIAAAHLHELTGDEWFGNAARFFWETVTQHRCYATGGTSSFEYWRDEPDVLGWQLSSQDAENCCTHNLLKLTKLLWQQRPDSRYADYFERALWNGILGTVSPDDPASIMYYVPMRSGLYRYYCERENAYVCCSGTGIESFGKLADFAYAEDAAGVWVNLFIPSEADWASRGVKLRQQTRFPDEEKTTITVVAKAPVEFALRVRRPFWCKDGFAVTVNGERVAAAVGDNGYAVVQRTWKDGDRVEVALPMALRTEPLGNRADRVAVLYGPVLLAQAMGKAEMTPEMQKGLGGDAYRMNVDGPAFAEACLMLDPAKPSGFADHAASAPLDFTATDVGGAQLQLMPFYRLRGQRYATYLRSSTAIARAKGTEAGEGRGDQLTVGHDEDSHDFQAWQSERGEAHGRTWVRSPLWFRYDLDVDRERPNELGVTFARDEDATTFELCVDGRVVATPTLAPTAGDDPLFTQTFPLPLEATKGHRRVAIAIRVPPAPRAVDRGNTTVPQAPTRRRTPRVFGLSMTPTK